MTLAGLLGANRLSDKLVYLVFDSWPDAIAKPIVDEIDAVVATANTGFLTIGAVLTIFFASNGIEAIRVALNRAYGDDDERPIWKLRLQSLSFVIIGAILMLLISVLLFFLPVYFLLIESDIPANNNGLCRSETISLFAAFGLLTFIVGIGAPQQGNSQGADSKSSKGSGINGAKMLRIYCP